MNSAEAVLKERTDGQPQKHSLVGGLIRRALAWRSKLIEVYRVRSVILLHPLVIHDRFYKGILWVMGNASYVKLRFPDVKKYFIIISTAAGRKKWAAGRDEDIHGLTLNEYVEDFGAENPGGTQLVIRNADFIDERDFYPVNVQKDYDIFFNSALWEVKRHELFLATLYDLKNHHRHEIKAASVLWFGPPRSRNSRLYPGLFYNLLEAWLERKTRRYARHIRSLYAKAVLDGIDVTTIEPMYRWEPDTIEKLRLWYNRSKIYLLLSKTEGVNRGAKEALLCNTPVLVIKGSTTAKEFVNDQTGEAVEDEQEKISQGILEMLERWQRYSPRSWALEHCPRTRTCKDLWEKINDIQKFPGYPDVDEANRIRRRYTAVPHDNHMDLNNWKGGGSQGSLGKEMRRIRKLFKECVPS